MRISTCRRSRAFSRCRGISPADPMARRIPYFRRLPFTISIPLSRLVLITAFGAALLIVGVRAFETAYFAGQIPVKIYIAIVGAIFLGIGALVGYRLRHPRPVVADDARHAPGDQAEPVASARADSVDDDAGASSIAPGL